jgi:hypothetical protein
MICRAILLRMRNVADKRFTENQNTRFVFNTFFPKHVPFIRYVAKYGTARQATDGIVIWHLRFALWTNKVTDSHSEYVILLIFYCKNGNANEPEYYVYVHYLLPTYWSLAVYFVLFLKCCFSLQNTNELLF